MASLKKPRVEHPPSESEDEDDVHATAEDKGDKDTSTDMKPAASDGSEDTVKEDSDDEEEEKEKIPSRRRTLSRSAKKANLSYKEVTAVPVLYYDSQSTRRKRRKSRSSSSDAPTPVSAKRPAAGVPVSPSAGKRSDAKVESEVNDNDEGEDEDEEEGDNEEAEEVEEEASDTPKPKAKSSSKSSSKSSAGKKVFFNHSVVQDTIWKALTDLGWSTTKPYKTQRNYHPPPKPDGSRTRVFDSIGRVMDFVRVDAEWRDNKRVQEGLAAYEKTTGDVGGSTSFNLKNKGLGTPRNKRKLQAEYNEDTFFEVMWHALEARGWEIRKYKGNKIFIKGQISYYRPRQRKQRISKQSSKNKEKEEQHQPMDVDENPKADETKSVNSSEKSDGSVDNSPDNVGDKARDSVDAAADAAAEASGTTDLKAETEAEDQSTEIENKPAEIEGKPTETVDPEAQNEENKPAKIGDDLKDSDTPPSGKSGEDYFETPLDVLRHVKENADLREQPGVKEALLQYETKVGGAHRKKKQKKPAKSPSAVAPVAANGVATPGAAAVGEGVGGSHKKKAAKTPTGLNKPRPHKFSNPIMQDTIWKALSEAGWTTAKRKNSSQRNYFPPKGCGSRRAVYQTITAVLDYVRTDMEWMLNEKVQMALKEYDWRLAVSLGDRASTVLTGSGSAGVAGTPLKTDVSTRLEEKLAAAESTVATMNGAASISAANNPGVATAAAVAAIPAPAAPVAVGTGAPVAPVIPAVAPAPEAAATAAVAPPATTPIVVMKTETKDPVPQNGNSAGSDSAMNGGGDAPTSVPAEGVASRLSQPVADTQPSPASVTGKPATDPPATDNAERASQQQETTTSVTTSNGATLTVDREVMI